MKQYSISTTFSFLVIIALDIVLFFSVIFLMNYVQKLLADDVKINLVEVVSQNKDATINKFKVEVANLEVLSHSFTADLFARQNKNTTEDFSEILKKIFFEYCIENNEDSVYMSFYDGTAFLSDGRTIDISDRYYFKRASQGINNISDRLVAKDSDAEFFVISVPLLFRGTIFGTLQRIYSPNDIYTSCLTPLFSSQGRFQIINGEGDIRFDSEHIEDYKMSENYFRTLCSQGNQEAAAQLKTDMKNNGFGFVETIINGEKMFSAYTPFDEKHDWYIISSVAAAVVSSNTTRVIKIFYAVLFAVVLIFAGSIICFFSYKDRQRSHLEHIAFVDSVTQGKSYTKFAIELHTILKKYPEKQFYLLAFDIDNFKYVNSFYGFDCGDRILKQINDTIEHQLVSPEIIARISGDHFVALLEDFSAERLDAIHNSVQTEEGIILHLSAGLYKITNPKESVNLMLDKAATAAQVIKNNVHKTVEIYTEEFDKQMIHNEQMKHDIKQALVDNEIIPFFQPKINVFTGKLVGLEALARWHTKRGELISPIEFIPICEKTGLIINVDMIIFEKTLQFLHKMRLQGRACVPVSVNFSRLHLGSKNFVEMIVKKLQQYDIPAHLLEIELTETIIFDNHEIIADFINQLHENGVRISMDDFGSGYSSLHMLKDIPIDVLKVDRGFLMETADITRRDIIFSTITQMANRLNIEVVIEGVETKENVELMKKFGCHIAQGYYFAKPMDEASFEVFYIKNTSWTENVMVE